MTELIGKRVYDTKRPLQVGEFQKSDLGHWFVRPPGVPHEIGITGGATEWDVVEHEDGTISVTPSINVIDIWHGYLTRGVWRSC